MMMKMTKMKLKNPTFFVQEDLWGNMSILNYLVKERDSLNVRLMTNLLSKHIVMYCLMLTQSLLFKSKCSIASELNTLLDTFYDNPLFLLQGA